MLFGTDPEFFLVDGEGKFRSASEVFKKKGEEEGYLYNKDNHYSYLLPQAFRDGFSMELNTTAHACRANLSNEVMNALKYIENAYLPKGWSLSTLACIPVELDYLKTLPDDVQKFGCEPSLNAYEDGKPFLPEVNGRKHPWRYAGGHLHFGLDGVILNYIKEIERKKLPFGVAYKEYQRLLDPKEAIKIVKLFDLTIGLPLSLIFSSKDEFQRRQLYGRAGEYRMQKWGIEYRVPSPKVWNHIIIPQMVLGVGRKMVRDFEKWWAIYEELEKKIPCFEEKLRDAINYGEGGFEFLQEVKGYYNPDVISFLMKEGKEVWKLNEFTFSKYGNECHTGFAEIFGGYVKAPRIPVDGGYVSN